MTSCPSSTYRAVVAAPFDDSSSGWACTVINRRRSPGAGGWTGRGADGVYCVAIGVGSSTVTGLGSRTGGLPAAGGEVVLRTILAEGTDRNRAEHGLRHRQRRHPHHLFPPGTCLRRTVAAGASGAAA
ncbi:hypothetical protein GCM10025792_01830 [Pseudonocardia tropica]